MSTALCSKCRLNYIDCQLMTGELHADCTTPAVSSAATVEWLGNQINMSQLYKYICIFILSSSIVSTSKFSCVGKLVFQVSYFVLSGT